MKKKYFMLMLFISGIPLAAQLSAQEDTIRVNFTNMTPHLNQDLSLYLRNPVSGVISDSVKVSPIESADFDTIFVGTFSGNYYLDFFADHNGNGMYDVPPTDHAWRIMLNDIDGDTTITFVHNTNFTDITWETADENNQLTVNLSSMTPHLNQDITFYLRNTTSGEVSDTIVVNDLDAANFSVVFDSLAIDSSYYVDFWADHNNNGEYDIPPTDHAWRLLVDSVQRDTTLNFIHNTNFTDITWETDGGDFYQLTVDFVGMTPHLNQDLSIWIKDAVTRVAVDSLFMTVDIADFSVVFDSLDVNTDYDFDFYADHNLNGQYDSPPIDHAWRIELDDIQSDTILEFVHNTVFTDIFEVVPTPYAVTLNFVDFDPHVDQDLILYLRDPVSGDFIDSIKVTPVTTGDFEVVFDSVALDMDYNLDFYADLNNNGVYDVPPIDHAWRIELVGIDADTTIDFVHNTNFTDIGLGTPTGIADVDKERGFSLYPVPARSELTISLLKAGKEISVYNAAGALVIKRSLTASDRLVKLNVSTLKSGIYILRLNSDSGFTQQKFLKE